LQASLSNFTNAIYIIIPWNSVRIK
jgi:hypothetical protein